MLILLEKVPLSGVFKGKLLAVVLTGMGSDGKEGVISISDAGGKIIAESDETAVVFGMPNAAIKTGKVDKVAPLRIVRNHLVPLYIASIYCYVTTTLYCILYPYYVVR